LFLSQVVPRFLKNAGVWSYKNKKNSYSSRFLGVLPMEKNQNQISKNELGILKPAIE